MSNNTTGRYSFDQIDNYSSGGGSFFSLKEDKEIARARFMANTLEDIPFYVVHEVQVNGKRQLVKCHRAHGDSLDACPFCKSGLKSSVKFYIPMYMEDEQQVRYWERGKTFAQKLSSLASRFNPLVNTLFEIQRLGAKGSTSTTYETFPIDTIQGQSILTQLPEVEDAIGKFILDKTPQEMENYLATGAFGNDTQQQAYPQRSDYMQTATVPTRRYVPVNNNNAPF